ncbi:MAG: MFS transporter [Actinomycetes bacterium]
MAEGAGEAPRRLRIDTRPLRTSRDFRLLFVGGSVSRLGSMVTYVCLPFQVKELTGSFVLVGALGLVELLPLVVFGLYGGALADAVDRRRMVRLTEAAFMLMSGVLLANALLPHPQLGPIYLFAFAGAAIDGLQRPSLDAMLPRIVGHDELVAASALNGLSGSLATMAGPAVGGVLIATIGVGAGYAFDVLTFGGSLVALTLMRAVPPPTGAERPSLRGVGAGLAYAWSRKDLLGTYLVDLSAMFFAFPYALFPFVADSLHAPWALGLLYSAGFVGSAIATATSGWTRHVHRHGRAIVYASAVWGAAIALFGLSSNIWLALVMLAVAGGGDMVSGIFRQLMWNQTIPDEVRGRMAGTELLSYSLGPQLGQVRSSLVAQWTSLRASIVSGGIACVAGAFVLAAALPSLWRYDERTDENARRERNIRAERASRGDS